MLMIILIFN